MKDERYLCCYDCVFFFEVFETGGCEPGYEVDCRYWGQYNSITPCEHFILKEENKYDTNLQIIQDKHKRKERKTCKRVSYNARSYLQG